VEKAGHPRGFPRARNTPPKLSRGRPSPCARAATWSPNRDLLGPRFQATGRFQGHCLLTVDALCSQRARTDDSPLMGVLDNFGAVLYFQEREKSIGPSGLDVSHVPGSEMNFSKWENGA